MGSDNEVQSDFQLIAGTNRDLTQDVVAGVFGKTCTRVSTCGPTPCPGCANGPKTSNPISTICSPSSAKKMAGWRASIARRARFMRFARAPEALWTGNFRDLWASVTRMATLAQAGRITEAIFDDEIAPLQRLWRPYLDHGKQRTAVSEEVIGAEAASKLDLLDVVQLEAVITVCRRSKSLSDAGRTLFGVSRGAKSQPNDADRLKKYLARFGLSWDRLFARQN